MSGQRGRTSSKILASIEDFGTIRAFAVGLAYCPVALAELRRRPCEVGALVCKGQRVESVLYLRSSVVCADGTLKVPNGVSPITGLEVDGFELVPPLQDKEAFLQFLDWSGDDHITAHEVAAVIAALLPVEEETVERFIRERFDVDREGVMTGGELVNGVLPYLMSDFRGFLAATRVSEVPVLYRDSPIADFQRWFLHWDINNSGELEHSTARFAIAVLFFSVLARDDDAASKETIVTTWLGRLGLWGLGRLPLKKFEERIVPALRPNLPVKSDPMSDSVIEKELLEAELQSPWTGERVPIQVSPLYDTARSLRDFAAERWPDVGRLHLYVEGTLLDDDSRNITDLHSLSAGAVIGVVPDSGGSSGASCTFA